MEGETLNVEAKFVLQASSGRYVSAFKEGDIHVAVPDAELSESSLLSFLRAEEEEEGSLTVQVVDDIVILRCSCLASKYRPRFLTAELEWGDSKASVQQFCIFNKCSDELRPDYSCSGGIKNGQKVLLQAIDNDAEERWLCEEGNGFSLNPNTSHATVFTVDIALAQRVMQKHRCKGTFRLKCPACTSVRPFPAFVRENHRRYVSNWRVPGKLALSLWSRGDPSHFCDVDGKELPFIETFDDFGQWQLSRTAETDSEGWQYADRFRDLAFNPVTETIQGGGCRSEKRYVRSRLWKKRPHLPPSATETEREELVGEAVFEEGLAVSDSQPVFEEAREETKTWKCVLKSGFLDECRDTSVTVGATSVSLHETSEFVPLAEIETITAVVQDAVPWIRLHLSKSLMNSLKKSLGQSWWERRTGQDRVVLVRAIEAEDDGKPTAESSEYAVSVGAIGGADAFKFTFSLLRALLAGVETSSECLMAFRQSLVEISNDLRRRVAASARVEASWSGASSVAGRQIGGGAMEDTSPVSFTVIDELVLAEADLQRKFAEAEELFEKAVPMAEELAASGFPALVHGEVEALVESSKREVRQVTALTTSMIPTLLREVETVCGILVKLMKSKHRQELLTAQKKLNSSTLSKTLGRKRQPSTLETVVTLHTRYKRLRGLYSELQQHMQEEEEEDGEVVITLPPPRALLDEWLEECRATQGTQGEAATDTNHQPWANILIGLLALNAILFVVMMMLTGNE